MQHLHPGMLYRPDRWSAYTRFIAYGDKHQYSRQGQLPIVDSRGRVWLISEKEPNLAFWLLADSFVEVND